MTGGTVGVVDHAERFEHQFHAKWTLTAFILLGVAVGIAARGQNSLWLVAAGIIGPDLSFLAAIGSTPLGPGLLAPRAVRPYNVVHRPITPVLVFAAGLATNTGWVTVIAISWLSHIAWDRGLGYALRNADGSIGRSDLGDGGTVQ